ncbi:MAG: 6-carboxy-5,6,7,8-tetrahydropterin synthase [Syntrophomonadaceae bacterium]|nr:6-carboxy-5,6,7,8-tetrahydropterin synthase [Bacillota bacterium]
MFTIRKKFRFEASHRLVSSYSICCQKLHGHSYILELFFRSDHLNEDGMVIDFGLVKDLLRPLLEEFDHRLILDKADDTKELRPHAFIFPYSPTAENMAKYIFDKVKKIFPAVSKVRVHETETGWAEYEQE